MMRLAVLAALVAVAVSAPTWTSQLASEATTSELATTTWTLGLAKGSYGTTDLGESTFNTLFHDSANHIVKRECSSCSSAYQEIYYRRFTDTSTWDVYDSLKENWMSANNTLGTDFGIYSSYDDAVANTNRWAYCNYDDPGIGFPRDCGVSSAVGNQWNSWTRGGKDVAYYVESPHSWTYAPTHPNVKGTYVHDCHCTACHFEIRDSGHEFKPDITSCAHECAWNPDCQTVLHDRIKSKCFWYHHVNSHNTPVPALKETGTYNSLTASGGNEFTCWYKNEAYELTYPPTMTPTVNHPTVDPTQYPTATRTPTAGYPSFDVFDYSTKGSKISLSNGNRTATSININHSWNSVYGTATVTSGTRSWSLNVTKLHDHTANYWEMVIGVATTTTRGESVFVHSAEGIGYIQQNGDKTQSGRSPDHTSYGSTYTVGDVIKVDLDLNNLELKFSKNGITQGTAFSSTGVNAISAGHTWRLAVMLGDDDDAVEIIA